MVYKKQNKTKHRSPETEITPSKHHKGLISRTGFRKRPKQNQKLNAILLFLKSGLGARARVRFLEKVRIDHQTRLGLGLGIREQ